MIGVNDDHRRRAARLAALADPVRLAVVDELWSCDLSPAELRQRLDIASNLLAHHLDVLEREGLIVRSRSSGDGRRRYVHLVPGALDGLVPGGRLPPERPLFVCTRNSARSQLAAALWRSTTGREAMSAGTHPADEIHPGARAAARRAGLPIGDARPRALETLDTAPELVITVCDQAHEELQPADGWLHWSIPDPVAAGTDAAFDAAVDELRRRIGEFTTSTGT